jgi:hypothetical protein
VEDIVILLIDSLRRPFPEQIVPERPGPGHQQVGSFARAVAVRVMIRKPSCSGGRRSCSGSATGFGRGRQTDTGEQSSLSAHGGRGASPVLFAPHAHGRSLWR